MHVVRGSFHVSRATGRLFRSVLLGGPISAELRINDRIRVPEVRLVGPNGEQVGIVAIGDALRLARSPISISSRSHQRPDRRSASSWTTASSSTNRP